MKKCLFMLLALATTLAVATSVRATDINFSFSGNGISSTGTLTVTPSSTAGVDEITAITGTFSDTNAGVSGAITGLYTPISYVSVTLALAPPGIAVTGGGLSYDDLFYPAGNSPAICYDLVNGKPTLTYRFSGGQFDIFGVAFDVGSGGYVGELWSNGYLPDSNGTFPGATGYVPNLVYAAGLANATALVDDPNSGPGAKTPPGRFGALSTPEPASLVLFGTGLLSLLGLAGVRARKHGLV